MHFLVIGCGSIGQRHIKNILRLGHRVSGCEKDPRKAGRLRDKTGIEVFTGLGRALDHSYDAAFICVPTSAHIDTAIKAARRGLDLFIEKPLSNTLKDINKLERVAGSKRLVTLVGCNLRFLKSFNAAKRLIDSGRIGRVLSAKAEYGHYLPYWRPGEDYSKSYSASRRLGGGIILDDIHEIDALRWLFGKIETLSCFARKVSDLKIDTEDVADTVMKFGSGIAAQLHCDYLRREPKRCYEFIGTGGVITLDCIKTTVKISSGGGRERTAFKGKGKSERAAMYLEQVRYFIDCVKKRKRTMNTVTDAKETLKAALACHRSSRAGEAVKV